MPRYDIYMTDETGEVVYSLDRYISLDYVLTVNDIGSANLVVPGSFNPIVGEDYRLKIYRDGVLVGNTHFFIVNPVLHMSGGETRTELACVTANAVLGWPIVNYAPGTIWSHASGYAGNVMKDIVRQNMGSDATDSGRDMSARLTVQANTNDGEVIVLDIGWSRALDAIKSIADTSLQYGTKIIFDVIENSGILQFVTMENIRGTDKSSSVLLSPDFDTFSNVSISYDYTRAASRAIVGGTGQEIWRNVVEVANVAQANNTPWGYIKEHFVGSERAATTSQAQAIGYSYLIANRNRVSVSGEVQNSAAVSYGGDYGWGDIISIESLGNVFTLSIETVSVNVANGEEKVSISAKGDAS